MRWVSSPRYTVDIGDHAFPTAKFQRVAEAAVAGGVLRADHRVEPELPRREHLLLVHEPDWVDRALDGRLTLEEETALELRWSRAMADAHALAVTGTMIAAAHALEDGLGLHVGGGAHHAFPDRGEGFCLFNDIACAIALLRRNGKIRRALVVDLDVHQGNGTAAIFRDEPDVFTFSMHQAEGYPTPKEMSTLDVGLPAGTRDREYHAILSERLPRILDSHGPELVVYQAGVDVCEGDMLGSLKLTAAGVAARDRFVFEECARRGIPVTLTLGGGYGSNLEATAALHVSTIREALAARSLDSKASGASR